MIVINEIWKLITKYYNIQIKAINLNYRKETITNSGHGINLKHLTINAMILENLESSPFLYKLHFYKVKSL